MALKTLKTFNTVDKKFDPEITMDKSTDNLLFNAQQVEDAYRNALNKANTFTNRVNMLGSQVSKISLAGIRGTNITNQIQNYREKVSKVTNSLATAKNTFSKLIQSRLDRVSTGEKDASRLAGLEVEFGKRNSLVGDSLMNTANDIISWASSIIDFDDNKKTSSDKRTNLTSSIDIEKEHQIIGPENGLPIGPSGKGETDWSKLNIFDFEDKDTNLSAEANSKHYDIEDLPPMYQEEARRMENQVIGPQWNNEVENYKNRIMEQVENTSNSFSSWMEEGKNNLNSVIDIIKDPAKNMPMPGDFEDGGLYL